MSKSENTVSPQESAGGCFVRMAWMLVGNIVLAVTVLSMVRKTTFFSLADAIFWGTIAALLAIRYLDIARFQGQTAAGEPANLSHWRRYALLLLAVGLLAWVGTHLIARSYAGPS